MIYYKEKIVTPLKFMPVGYSFFYPTYDELDAAKRLRKEAKERGIEISMVTGVEKGVYGIRVIRVK